MRAANADRRRDHETRTEVVLSGLGGNWRTPSTAKPSGARKWRAHHHARPSNDAPARMASLEQQGKDRRSRRLRAARANPSSYSPTTRVAAGPVIHPCRHSQAAGCGCPANVQSMRAAASEPGLSVSPHSFSRGNRTAIHNADAQPHGPARNAAMLPAGLRPPRECPASHRPSGIVPQASGCLGHQGSSPGVRAVPGHRG